MGAANGRGAGMERTVDMMRSRASAELGIGSRSASPTHSGRVDSNDSFDRMEVIGCSGVCSRMKVLGQQRAQTLATATHTHLERRNPNAGQGGDFLVRQFFGKAKHNGLTLLGAQLRQGMG